jgi:hypothetical protein
MTVCYISGILSILGILLSAVLKFTLGRIESTAAKELDGLDVLAYFLFLPCPSVRRSYLTELRATVKELQ